MVEPTGYTALDLIGFTDRGDYDPSAYYVKNDLVHDGVDNIWRVLIDDTHGVTPAEGLNYTIFIRNHGTEAEEIIAPVESNPAAAAHAVGTQLINDGDLYEVTTAIAVGDSLVAYPTSGYNIKAADSITGQLKSVKNGLGTAAAKNFTTSVTSGSGDLVTSGAVASQIQTLTNNDNAMLNVLGAKNLCPNDAVNQTINGVIFQINNQVHNVNYKAFSATGTNDGSALSILVLGTVTLPYGTYILSGCPSGGSSATYALNAYDDTNINAVDFGDGATFDVRYSGATVTIRFIVYRNATINASIFPMIRPASIADDTYVPYTKTNRELTAENQTKVTIKKATINARSTYTYELEAGAYMVASTGSYASLLALSIGVGYGAGDTRNKLSAIIPASNGEITFVAEPSYFGVRCANASDYPITFYLIQ